MWDPPPEDQVCLSASLSVCLCLSVSDVLQSRHILLIWYTHGPDAILYEPEHAFRICIYSFIMCLHIVYMLMLCYMMSYWCWCSYFMLMLWRKTKKLDQTCRRRDNRLVRDESLIILRSLRYFWDFSEPCLDSGLIITRPCDRWCDCEFFLTSVSANMNSRQRCGQRCGLGWEQNG